MLDIADALPAEFGTPRRKRPEARRDHPRHQPEGLGGRSPCRAPVACRIGRSGSSPGRPSPSASPGWSSLVLVSILRAATGAAASSVDIWPPRRHDRRPRPGSTTVLSLIVGIALAWALNRLRFPGRDLDRRPLRLGHRHPRPHHRLRPARRLGPRRLGQRSVARAHRPAARTADLRPRRHPRGPRHPRCQLRRAHPPRPPRRHPRSAAQDGPEPRPLAPCSASPSSTGRCSARPCPASAPSSSSSPSPASPSCCCWAAAPPTRRWKSPSTPPSASISTSPARCNWPSCRSPSAPPSSSPPPPLPRCRPPRAARARRAGATPAAVRSLQWAILAVGIVGFALPLARHPGRRHRPGHHRRSPSAKLLARPRHQPRASAPAPPR